jgi:hypothetical protein
MTTRAIVAALAFAFLMATPAVAKVSFDTAAKVTAASKATDLSARKKVVKKKAKKPRKAKRAVVRYAGQAGCSDDRYCHMTAAIETPAFSTGFTASYSGGLGPKPAASCGWYMRAQFGGKYGPEFNRAYAWASLPRTTLQPGALVVSARKGKGCGGPCGHVVKVVEVIDKCRAIVNDNKGTYERNTCRARVAVVMPQ